MDAETIYDQVRQRFSSVASDPASEKHFEIGRASALKLGYDAAIVDGLPVSAVESFAGVGNPLAVEPLADGMTVLDLGCGAGVDTMIAARMVGSSGKVIGIDMTDEMV